MAQHLTPQQYAEHLWGEPLSESDRSPPSVSTARKNDKTAGSKAESSDQR
jgi:hypothetical protein